VEKIEAEIEKKRKRGEIQKVGACLYKVATR
jgi:hypothetical protein